MIYQTPVHCTVKEFIYAIKPEHTHYNVKLICKMTFSKSCTFELKIPLVIPCFGNRFVSCNLQQQSIDHAVRQ